MCGEQSKSRFVLNFFDRFTGFKFIVLYFWAIIKVNVFLWTVDFCGVYQNVAIHTDSYSKKVKELIHNRYTCWILSQMC